MLTNPKSTDTKTFYILLTKKIVSVVRPIKSKTTLDDLITQTRTD